MLISVLNMLIKSAIRGNNFLGTMAAYLTSIMKISLYYKEKFSLSMGILRCDLLLKVKLSAPSIVASAEGGALSFTDHGLSFVLVS